MSCTVRMVAAPVSSGERRSDRLRYALVKLVRDDASDVIGLDDAREITHCRTRLPGTGLGCRTRSRRRCVCLPASLSVLRRDPSAAPGGGRGGRPRRPGRRARSPRRRCGWVSITALASASRSSARFCGRVRGQPDHVPAARRGQPGGVLLAQVIAVRLDVRGQRAEHRGRVAVHVGQRVHRRMLACGARAATRTHPAHLAHITVTTRMPGPRDGIGYNRDGIRPRTVTPSPRAGAVLVSCSVPYPGVRVIRSCVMAAAGAGGVGAPGGGVILYAR